MVVIRLSRAEDGPVLREIERLAGEAFRHVGLDSIADDEPASLEVLAAYATAGWAWTACDADGTPVGYLLVDLVDDAVHIEQISVRPDHQGVGVGRALIETARRWSQARGSPALTLTTFAQVPWNAPLYEHLGFRVLSEHEIGPGLRALRDAETARGLDPTIRVCMMRSTALDRLV